MRVHIHDVVEILGVAEVRIVQKRLPRPIPAHPEIQDVEATPALIQQIIQRFREGVGRVHLVVLNERIAEDADVGRGSQIGLTDIPMLSKSEIVVIERVDQTGVGVDHRISSIRRAGPELSRIVVEL